MGTTNSNNLTPEGDPKPESRFKENREEIRIGILGIPPGRAVKYGKVFNESAAYPGVQVQYLWLEGKELTSSTAWEGNIPHTMEDPQEMPGKVNALILGHEYPGYFLDMATPFLKERIPVFVQVPFSYRLEEGKEFLQMARIYDTPVSSFSSIAYCETTFSLKKQVEKLGKIEQIIGYGPVDVNEKHAGIFDHVIHMVQSLMIIFGDEIEYVRVLTAGRKGSASLVFHGGLLVTLIFKSHTYGWETFVETGDGITELVSYVKKDHPLMFYNDMIGLFRTGKEPVSHKSMLRCVAVLEAMGKSVHTQNWEEVRD